MEDSGRTPSSTAWQATIPFFDYIKAAGSNKTISQRHYVHAEIKNDKLYMSCDCNLGHKGALCDHMARAAAGDIFLLANRSRENQDALIQLWNYAATTRLYSDVCDLAEIRATFTQNERMLNDELKKRNSPDFNIKLKDETDAKIKNLRAESRRIKCIIASKEAEILDFLVTTGYSLDTHTKRDNALRVLEYVSNDKYDKSIYLPIFLPEDADNNGWYMPLCSAFASSFGLVTAERSKFKKNYTVRIQTDNFSFSEGYIFYDSPLARKAGVAWGDALPHIHNIVQVRDVRNAEKDGKIIPIIKFTTDTPTKGKVFVELPVTDFIKYLICGEL